VARAPIAACASVARSRGKRWPMTGCSAPLAARSSARRVSSALWPGVIGPKLSRVMPVPALPTSVATAAALCRTITPRPRPRPRPVRPVSARYAPVARTARSTAGQPSEGCGTQVSLDLPAGDPGLPPVVALAAYRIVQESLSNTGRHAPGTPISVAVQEKAGSVQVNIENEPAAVSLPTARDAAGVKRRWRLGSVPWRLRQPRVVRLPVDQVLHLCPRQFHPHGPEVNEQAESRHYEHVPPERQVARVRRRQRLLVT
jgi:hypothetical protein